METFMLICCVICGLYGAYHAIMCVAGFLVKKPEPLPECVPVTRIAAIVAARNEEKVVGNLVKSLMAQNYPNALYDVYVIPNNCTDSTELVALREGARIMHCSVPVHSKGEVVHDAFEQLLAMNKYDAYCVFDADNVVHPDFLRHVNNTVQAGYNAAQGFRDSKNPGDSWVSGSMSAFYWYMCRFFNESRFRLGLSAHMNGTGFMVTDRLIRRLGGWNTYSLTEDLEFTAICALNDERVYWMRDARIYDEQPMKFWTSVVQRRRWTAGGVQCMRRYTLKLLRKHTACSIDMAHLFIGNVFGFASLVPAVCTVIMSLGDLSTLTQSILLGAMSSVGTIAAMIAFAAVLFAIEKKLDRHAIAGILGFPVLLCTWLPINIYACLTKAPVWKEIKHTRDITIPFEKTASEPVLELELPMREALTRKTA